MALDKAFIKEMEDGLKVEKTKLQAQLAEISTNSSRNPGENTASFPNFGDAEDENAAEVTTFSNNLTLERTLETGLRDVDKALASIANGTYGVCKYCHKEIDEKRLRARPASSSCIDCKKKLTLES
jgi:DnaK suppressor protein